MAVLTVRNHPDALHQALRARAARLGLSMEAEAREILASALGAEGQGEVGLAAGRHRRAGPSD